MNFMFDKKEEKPVEEVEGKASKYYNSLIRLLTSDKKIKKGF